MDREAQALLTLKSVYLIYKAVLVSKCCSNMHLNRVEITKGSKFQQYDFTGRLVRQYCWHVIVNESLILIRNDESIRPRVMHLFSRGEG
jgi:hypothetical protein